MVEYVLRREKRTGAGIAGPIYAEMVANQLASGGMATGQVSVDGDKSGGWIKSWISAAYHSSWARWPLGALGKRLDHPASRNGSPLARPGR